MHSRRHVPSLPAHVMALQVLHSPRWEATYNLFGKPRQEVIVRSHTKPPARRHFNIGEREYELFRRTSLKPLEEAEMTTKTRRRAKPKQAEPETGEVIEADDLDLDDDLSDLDEVEAEAPEPEPDEDDGEDEPDEKPAPKRRRRSRAKAEPVEESTGNGTVPSPLEVVSEAVEAFSQAPGAGTLKDAREAFVSAQAELDMVSKELEGRRGQFATQARSYIEEQQALFADLLGEDGDEPEPTQRKRSTRKPKGTAQGSQPESKREFIVGYLSKVGEAPIGDILDALVKVGLSEDTDAGEHALQVTLSRMVKAEEIGRTKPGVYHGYED